jgi:hypothetical protein
MTHTPFDTPMGKPQELNLTAHREAGASVWDRRGWDGTTEYAMTRWLVGVGGGALAIEGIRRRGATGSFFAGLGGTLVWWALTGQGDLSTARRWFADTLEHAPWRSTDQVQEASADSFPASDAPSFTPTVGTGPRPARSASSGSTTGDVEPPTSPRRSRKSGRPAAN